MGIRNLNDPGSGMENLDPESGINVPDPQHRSIINVKGLAHEMNICLKAYLEVLCH
jgi:hypothetical protein